MGRTGHQQGRSGLDQHAGWDAIDAEQLCLFHANALGRIGRLHCRGGLPGRPTGQLGAALRQQVDLEDGRVVPWQQDLWGARRQNHGPVGRRIERLEVVEFDLGEARCHADIDITRDVHCLKVRVVLHHRQRGAKRRWRRDDVFHRLQLGHIQACFCRHGQIRVARTEPGAAVLLDRTAHAAFAPVVGGQCQVPVAKHAVQLLQVIQRRAGGGQHVTAVIAKRVLLEFEVLAGSWHELPHPGCLGA